MDEKSLRRGRCGAVAVAEDGAVAVDGCRRSFGSRWRKKGKKGRRKARRGEFIFLHNLLLELKDFYEPPFAGFVSDCIKDQMKERGKMVELIYRWCCDKERGLPSRKAWRATSYLMYQVTLLYEINYHCFYLSCNQNHMTQTLSALDVKKSPATSHQGRFFHCRHHSAFLAISLINFIIAELPQGGR